MYKEIKIIDILYVIQHIMTRVQYIIDGSKIKSINERTLNQKKKRPKSKLCDDIINKHQLYIEDIWTIRVLI